MTETSWGVELWDCFDKVLQEVRTSSDVRIRLRLSLSLFWIILCLAQLSFNVNCRFPSIMVESLEQIETFTSTTKVYDWVNLCSKSPSPPPPPLPSQPPVQLLAHVVALYPFVGKVENSLSIEEGEELMVTEPDVEGWTRVRRLNSALDQIMEGFVPSSFIKFLS